MILIIPVLWDMGWCHIRKWCMDKNLYQDQRLDDPGNSKVSCLYNILIIYIDKYRHTLLLACVP